MPLAADRAYGDLRACVLDLVEQPPRVGRIAIAVERERDRAPGPVAAAYFNGCAAGSRPPARRTRIGRLAGRRGQRR